MIKCLYSLLESITLKFKPLNKKGKGKPSRFQGATKIKKSRNALEVLLSTSHDEKQQEFSVSRVDSVYGPYKN